MGERAEREAHRCRAESKAFILRSFQTATLVASALEPLRVSAVAARAICQDLRSKAPDQLRLDLRQLRLSVPALRMYQRCLLWLLAFLVAPWW